MKIVGWASVAVLLCSGMTCLEPYRPKEPAPSTNQDKSAPADTVFALGVWNNSGGAPQAASLVNLRFGEGSPDEENVIAAKVLSPLHIDGNASDWAFAPISTIPLSPRGTASGLSEEEWAREYQLATGNVPFFDFGITQADVRAAYDDDYVYLLVQWEDATEDRRRDEWLFDGVKWTRSRNNEDRLSFAFNIDNTFRGFNDIGCAAACHIKTKLGDVSDAGRATRFRMHTGRPGELADVWLWRATTSDPMGHADDAYWDETGRKGDGTLDWSTSNSRNTDAGAVPIYMSQDGINANPTRLYKDDAGLPRAVDFNGEGAVAGTRIPGHVAQRASPGRDDIRAVGKWSNGQWTVEFARVRETADPKDTRFNTP